MARPPTNWLHSLAASAARAARFPCLEDVFPVEINGSCWSAVTDWRYVLAIQDDGELVTRTPPAEGHDKVQHAIQRYLALDFRDWQRTPIADLKNWLPTHEPPDDDLFMGIIAGAMVDVCLLSRVLREELLSLSNSKRAAFCRMGQRRPLGYEERSMLFVKGEMWQLLLMGVATDVEPLPLFLPGLGGIWHRRHDASGRLEIAEFYEAHGYPEYARHIRSHSLPW